MAKTSLRCSDHNTYQYHQTLPTLEDAESDFSRRSCSLIRYSYHRHVLADNDELWSTRLSSDIWRCSNCDKLANVYHKCEPNTKESGRRRFLSFFQRGFNAKRSKPTMKFGQKKSIKKSIPFDISRSYSISTSKALRLLGEQIPFLAMEIYQNYGTKPTLKSLKFANHLKEFESLSNLIRVWMFHSSLIGREWGYCFQVTSLNLNTNNESLDANPNPDVVDKEEFHQSEENGKLYSPTNKITSMSYSYACTSALERNRWVQYLKRVVDPSLDSRRRQESCLNVWIQEAKKLPAKNYYYCTIRLDNGSVYGRTTIKQMTDMLFWGEEFDLSGPDKCTNLIIELWKAPNASYLHSTKQGAPELGLADQPNFQLGRYQPNSRARLSNPVQSPPGSMRKSVMGCAKGNLDDLDVHDLNGMQLAESQSDVDAVKNIHSYLLSLSANGYQTGRSGMYKRYKTKWNSKSRECCLMATVTISLNQLMNAGEVESWYSSDDTQLSEWLPSANSAKAAPNTNGKVRRNSSIHHHSVNHLAEFQIRLKIKYRPLDVLCLTSYSRLLNYLVTDYSNQSNLIALLSDLDAWLAVKSKTELASSLIGLHEALGIVPQFLIEMILSDVRKQNDINMILRTNTIATKATEIYLRLIGSNYLKCILHDFVHYIISETGSSNQAHQSNQGKTGSKQPTDYEVDGSKIQCSTQLEQNQTNLINLVQMVWTRIVNSVHQFPAQLKLVFAEVRKNLESSNGTHSPSNNQSLSTQSISLSEHVISACLFLRYICPAILSPSLFNLIHEFPSEPRILRAFTLVAKTIQSLANFTLFSGTKEYYMTFMNKFVQKQLQPMRQFIDSISSYPLEDEQQRSAAKGHLVTTTNGQLSVNSSNEHESSTDNGVDCQSKTSPGPMSISQSHHNALGQSTDDDVDMELDDTENNKLVTHNSTSNLFSTNTTFQSGQPLNTKQSNSNDTLTTKDDAWSVECNSSEVISHPIQLPVLPHTINSNLGTWDRMDVDMPLCLALCHLNLSEALKKVPDDKHQDNMLELKSILDEIDMYIATGFEPHISTKHQKSKSLVTPSQTEQSPTPTLDTSKDTVTHSSNSIYSQLSSSQFKPKPDCNLTPLSKSSNRLVVIESRERMRNGGTPIRTRMNMPRSTSKPQVSSNPQTSVVVQTSPASTSPPTIGNSKSIQNSQTTVPDRINQVEQPPHSMIYTQNSVTCTSSPPSNDMPNKIPMHYTTLMVTSPHRTLTRSQSRNEDSSSHVYVNMHDVRNWSHPLDQNTRIHGLDADSLWSSSVPDKTTTNTSVVTPFESPFHRSYSHLQMGSFKSDYPHMLLAHSSAHVQTQQNGLLSSYGPVELSDLQRELDQSQARLAEAQARLLMNEAERIHLLRVWNGEYKKQHQLMNAKNRSNSSQMNKVQQQQQQQQQNSTFAVSQWKSEQDFQNCSDFPTTVIDDGSRSDRWKMYSSPPQAKHHNFHQHRVHSTQPRMGAFAICPPMHLDSASDCQTSSSSTTIPSRQQKQPSTASSLHRTHTSLNGTQSHCSSTSLEKQYNDPQCLLSRSPSTPTFLYQPSVTLYGQTSLWPSNIPYVSQSPIVNHDDEFAKQIQTLVNQNKPHFDSDE